MERDLLPHLLTDASLPREAQTLSPPFAFLVSLRPDQWTKNLIVFAGLMFGQLLLDGPAVPISQWLLVCTLLLALFLGLAKRRHQFVLLGDSAAGHRRALAEYSPQLLDQLISIVAAARS